MYQFCTKAFNFLAFPARRGQEMLNVGRIKPITSWPIDRPPAQWALLSFETPIAGVTKK
jgi:hypothetical protein